jgi:hypothetical protein
MLAQSMPDRVGPAQLGPAQLSRRTTSGLQIGWARAANNQAANNQASSNRTASNRAGEAENAGATAATGGPVPPEQPRGPQLSEQLDLLEEVLAFRRLADLQRRGLFIRPEVF